MKAGYVAIAACTAAAILAAAGCSREAPGAADTGASDKREAAESRPAEKKAPADGAGGTIARVDDAVLDRAGLEAQIALRGELMKIRRGRFGEKDAAALRERLTKTAADRFIKRELLVKYARLNGIALEESELAKFRADAAKAHKRKSYDELRKRLAARSAALLDDETAADALAKKAEAAIRGGIDKTISEAEIAKIYGNIDAINSVAAQTNALVYAQATNVYLKIKSGRLLFEEAVEDYSEAEEATSDGAWNEFLLSELRDEAELVKLLPGMSPGDITPPIESDNGLAILKLSSTGEFTGKDGEKQPTYRLARIFFRLPLFYEKPAREELEKAILEKRANEALQAALKKTGDASRIEGSLSQRRREAARKRGANAPGAAGPSK